MKNVLEWLEAAAGRWPDKTAFADENEHLTYRVFRGRARAVGSALLEQGVGGTPVAVLAPRSARQLAAMLGVVYSGGFYAVIDAEMPNDRITGILETLHPAAILTDEACRAKAESLPFTGVVVSLQEAMAAPIQEKALAAVRSRMIDTDPLYALFTSGSTGVPKGAVVCHRNVIDYIDWYAETFGIGAETVFGSQTPFYFSMSVSDVFSTLRSGGTLHVIPRELFSFPMNLMEFLSERKVNTIYWVPSALCILANWKIFSYGQLPCLKKILFAGETMPTRQLNYWIAQFPNALFANLFGPTETTDICTYYVVDRPFADGEALPIGRPCDNCDVFVVKEDGTEAVGEEMGELYVRGSFLALGYYNNPGKTDAAFVQNPLNPHYPERVYRTGDLVRRNERGELMYVCRKDFQIKHMGYRIELGEIEAAAGRIADISACCCVYDAGQDKLVLIWQGKKSLEDATLMERLRERLPSYMLPNILIRVRSMPYNQNGKMNRAWLKSNYASLKR